MTSTPQNWLVVHLHHSGIPTDASLLLVTLDTSHPSSNANYSLYHIVSRFSTIFVVTSMHVLNCNDLNEILKT